MMHALFAVRAYDAYSYGMNILLTNDDGIDAPGLHAAYEAVRSLGTVHVVAPDRERSACSHMITLRSPIRVTQFADHKPYGACFAVDGSPADCVRLAIAALIDTPIDLVVSGINRGANSGVDVFYSGTVAGAREGAILGIRSIAVSQAIRGDVEIDWPAASAISRYLVESLLAEPQSSPAFWNVNLPSPIPAHPRDHIHRVPLATHAMPMNFERMELDYAESNEENPSNDNRRALHESGTSARAADSATEQRTSARAVRTMSFEYGASYWVRETTGPSDYTTIRDGEIAVTEVPLFP